jgi:hypothetical protein
LVVEGLSQHPNNDRAGSNSRDSISIHMQ